MYGWTGKLLRVNLTTKACTVESSEKYFKYIGGKGMANRIMYDEVPAGTDPNSVENKLVFAIGPNTGSNAPCSGRTTIATLSCFTENGAIVDAHMGGDTAVMMKGCGFDAVIIEGASEAPCYIYVTDNAAEVRDAAHIWGKGNRETTALITKETTAGVNVVSIGQAGENLVNLSCLITGIAHCGGAGTGKIMGLKKCKAIAFYGTQGMQVADPKKVMELNDYVMKDLIGSNNNHVVPTVMQSWSEYSNKSSRWTGHPGLTWGAAEGGPIDTGESAPGQPTLVGYRCQKAYKDHGAPADQYTVKMTGCATCPIRCYGSLYIPQMEKTWGVVGAHANTCLGNRGSSIGTTFIKNVKDVEVEGDGKLMLSVYAAIKSDDLGLWDNYGELAATLGYVMADDHKILKQILTEEEYNALPWDRANNGDVNALDDFYAALINPNHNMYKLTQGAYFVAKTFPELMGDTYLNSKALGLWGVMGGKKHHSSETAAQVGLLTNVLYNRDGMCHTIVNITGSGLPYEIQRNIIEDIFGVGALDKPSNYTPINESKIKFAKFGIMRQVLHDSFTLCNWVWPMTFSPRKERGYRGDLSVEAQYMAAITGEDWTEESLDHAVERDIQLHRAMTIMAYKTTDMRNTHDVVAEWVYNDEKAYTEGNTYLSHEDWQDALTMFYNQFGWNENGAPTRATLEKFDLKDVADDLEALGLLG